ncbi:MAG: VWA domain-containing protein [Acidobacteria bacterium]|nr:VWA domain-containing protein [Acidobacteriota bacterium]
MNTSTYSRRRGLVLATALAASGLLPVSGRPHAQARQEGEGFRFRTGVELINVTATVTDSTGRFVPGLRKEDFVVYEDGALQQITHFSNDRVPVSLGIALDTSSSMAGDKFAAARSALDRFLYDLLGRDDEMFLYRFSNDPILVQDWTANRDLMSRAMGRITPSGATAMYDTVAEAVPMAQQGRNRKKAIVVISDGNDTASRTDVPELKQLIRETEVLVYAVGIDGHGDTTWSQPRVPIPIPLPFPIPGRRRPFPFPPPGGGGGGGGYSRSSDRVNVMALREITDDSGGRTEIVRSARDLDPATANIADELSKQYYLGYPASAPRDGRWHTIRVEVRQRGYTVRARRGYVATP